MAEAGFSTFIPSTAVSQYTGWVLFFAITAVAVGYTFGFNWFWYDVKLRLDKLAPERRSKWLTNYWLGGWRIFKTIGLVLFGILWVYLFCVRLIPHLVVLADGERGIQEFTVERLSGVRFCWNAVVFQERPFLANRICRVPRDIRTKLKPGTKVIVHGTKSWAGIIPETIEIKGEQ